MYNSPVCNKFNREILWYFSIQLVKYIELQKKLYMSGHNINAMIGTEAVDNKSDFINAGRSTYSYENLDYMVLDAGQTNMTNSGSFDRWALFSYFGRLNYDLDGKYLIEAVIRRDGSSRFVGENRWATFPAFSAGWRISKESFMTNAGMDK